MLVLALCAICAASVLLTALVKSLIDYVRVLKYMHQLPSPPSSWNFLIGNFFPLLDTPANIFKVFRQWAKEFPSIYLMWAGPIAIANIVNPYDAELILSNPKNNEKSYLYDVLRPWLGNGLLISKGAMWQKRRKILTTSFHFNILQDYIKVFNEETKRFVDIFRRECHKPYTPITGHMNDFALNTVTEAVFGTSFGEKSEYKKALHTLEQLLLYKLLRPWLLVPFIYFFTSNRWKESGFVKILHETSKNLIVGRKKHFKPIDLENLSDSPRKRLALLDLLLTLKQQDEINDNGIREEVDTFMFGGHDTISVALSFILMLLAMHPEVQERIVDEMQEVLTESEPNYKSLQELKYMERCVKECLRLYPPVPFISRTLGEDVTTHEGYHLKSGSVVSVFMYDLHRNPKYFPDPEKFNPDRFLPENSRDRHPFAFIPFSAGSRNCIGQKFALLEIKAFLCGILSEFVLEAVDKPSDVVKIAAMTIQTLEPIKVKFRPREKKL